MLSRNPCDCADNVAFHFWLPATFEYREILISNLLYTVDSDPMLLVRPSPKIEGIKHAIKTMPGDRNFDSEVSKGETKLKRFSILR